MRSRIGTLLVPLALTFSCVAEVAYSQTGVVVSSAAGSVAPGSITPVQVGSGRYAYSTVMYNTQPVAGKPYSAKSTSTTIKTLPGGITITQVSATESLCRDAQGRTRTERTIGTQTMADAPPLPTVVVIKDPVASIGYVLDQSTQTAYRIKMAPLQTLLPAAAVQAQQAAQVIGAVTPRVAAQSFTNAQGVETRNESLGTQLMEGLEVTGTRQTMVYPGNFDGKARPITVTVENWFSLALGISVLNKRNDPRSGDYTSRHTNISLVNPDFSLFQPPADYQIVDIDGPAVTIRMN
jgi:hypothetical protein